MRTQIGLLVTFLAALTSNSASSQPDDDAVCRQLAKLSHSGLFIAYETSAGIRIADTNAGRVPYSPDARFYFVSKALSYGTESVWHVRTQTQAASAPGADAAIVYRPPVKTQCSRGSALPAFSKSRRYVPLARYIDHNHGQTDSGLREYFHFEIQDPSHPGHCIRTDDRTVFNLNDVYGFRDVPRPEPLLARAFSFSQTASAATSKYYAGLSSEFTYRSRGETSCFGFIAPLPTYPVSGGWFEERDSRAHRAAKVWKPTLTWVVIKQLSAGGAVTPTVDTTISWAR
jgi:hypothetical protein